MEDQTPMDLEAIQSRIRELTEIGRNCHDDANVIASDEDVLLRECVLQLEGRISEIIEEYSDVNSLQPEELDTYLENLKGKLGFVEVENAKLCDEVGNLMKVYFDDSIRLQSNIEGLNSSLEFIQSQGHEAKVADVRLESNIAELEGAHGSCNFKILELNSQIEKKKGMLKSLEKLDYTLKRFEGFLNIEDSFTGLEVMEYEGNRISLSLRTYIPEIDMVEQNHELAIELLDGTLDLNNAEIFPNDLYIGEIIDAAKSFVHQVSSLPMFENKTSLEWFVRRVQDRIVLSTLRKSLVKAASKSRHFIEYVDRDETIVAHMVDGVDAFMDGVDAFIKVSQGWPVVTSSLKLLSLKGSSQSSKEVTFSFLCKVEEMVNALDVQVSQNLSTFIDAIEKILKQRKHIELQSSSSINK